MTSTDGTHGPAIEVRGLHKRYGATHALRGLDLEVAAGTVYGLLGPNGAGKSTIVRVLSTLTDADDGEVRVAGIDVRRDPAAVRFRIGLAGQHAAVDEKITGVDNLRLFGRLYHLPERTVRARADDLLDRFGLTDAGARLVGTYSGGMRRRLDLAASLLVSPAVLFLDEPTTGLDPRSRGEVWDAVRALADAGTTVLLTTQYLEEADRLAERVAVVDAGRVIAEGTPAQLKARVGADRVEAVVAVADLERAATALGAATDGPVRTDRERGVVSAPTGRGAATLVAAVRAFDDAGVATEDLALRRPTLDDVFLRLTGRDAGSAATVDRARDAREAA